MLKAEIGTDSWPHPAAARRDIENWIELYNGRLHSSLVYTTLVESHTVFWLWGSGEVGAH